MKLTKPLPEGMRGGAVADVTTAPDEFVSAKPPITHSRVREMLHGIARNKTPLAIIIVALVFLTAAFAYGLLIWPTPYVIVHEKGEVFRVNRFTGIRQWSTKKGWMTEEQMEADAKAEAEQEAAFWRAKSAQVLKELNAVTVDGNSRDDFNKIVIYNPTDWELTPANSYDENTVVEYYAQERGRERFICKAEQTNYFLKPRAYNTVDLSPRFGAKTPTEIESLPAGTNFVQRITITFNIANNKTSGSADDKYIKLQPPFVLKKDRAWTQLADISDLADEPAP